MEKENIEKLLLEINLNKKGAEDVEQLYLRNNKLGDNKNNMIYITEGLKFNTSIQTSYLRNNKLGVNEKNMMYIT